MISKEDFLNAEFFKQFKDSKDFASFMEELYVRGTERMLEAEMDQHLGYEKHAPEGRNGGNSRNGKTSKTLKSKYGAVGIKVPRDRASTFEPVVVLWAQQPGRGHRRAGDLALCQGHEHTRY